MQEDTFYQIRRELHQHPELSGHEARTARFAEDKLQAFNPTKIIRHVGGHGLLVEYIFLGRRSHRPVPSRHRCRRCTRTGRDTPPFTNSGSGAQVRSRWPHDHTAPVCSNVIGTPVDKRTHTAPFPTGRRERLWLKSRAGHEGAGLLPDRQDVCPAQHTGLPVARRSLQGR